MRVGHPFSLCYDYLFLFCRRLYLITCIAIFITIAITSTVAGTTAFAAAAIRRLCVGWHRKQNNKHDRYCDLYHFF
jgi:hypothetical protein